MAFSLVSGKKCKTANLISLTLASGVRELAIKILPSLKITNPLVTLILYSRLFDPATVFSRSIFVFLLQRNDTRRPEGPDTESPALSTCSNADIFRRMNTMLGNALDFTGVCTTPNSTKGKPDMLCGKGLMLLFQG